MILEVVIGSERIQPLERAFQELQNEINRNFFLFWLKSYGLSKVHYCMVVVGFGTFRPFFLGWLKLCEEKSNY